MEIEKKNRPTRSESEKGEQVKNWKRKREDTKEDEEEGKTKLVRGR